MIWYKRIYLKCQHALFANTLHGTHSPFVYEMLEKVFYAPRKAKSLSELLLRIRLRYHLEGMIGIGYAADETLRPLGKWFEFDEQALLHLEGGNVIELLILGKCHHPKVLVNYFNGLLPYCNAHSMIVINDISKTEAMLEAWHTICNSESVKQCLDFHDFGIILFRNQQVKEYFRLKWR